MALHSWSPELGFSEKLKQVAVSTGPSLDLSTFPSTLGSFVATAALEQLFIVEQSLQSDYFKCNEEATIFLKDIAIAVRRLGKLCSAISQADGCQYSSGGGSLSRRLSSAKDVQLQLRPAPHCVLTRWKIACLTKRHGRWLLKMKEELHTVMDQIKAAEDRRSELIEETSVTEKEITENLVQIKKVALDLKQTETEFVINEKKLIQELSKYESKLKRELQQLRDQESDRIKGHFEILKNLENEIYAHDLETEALLLENERLRKYIAYIKTKIEPYAQEAKTYIYCDLSWHLIANYGR
ncbi:hypothetical protein MDA_GLEAN10023898 [Myotis davidii]|uniref:Uncharacterized protein n=1 Tax=Myotis davidii TaxID=225400 RepID=L5LMJ1_MYODS|nr:hypothetical protein MDA_GLEAN10023898 [Myotis davidii]